MPLFLDIGKQKLLKNTIASVKTAEQRSRFWSDLPELDPELMKSAGTGVPCSFAGEGEKCSVTVPPREPTAGVGETKRVPGLTGLGSGLWIMPSQPQFKSPHYLPPRGPKIISHPQLANVHFWLPCFECLKSLLSPVDINCGWEITFVPVHRVERVADASGHFPRVGTHFVDAF